MFKKVVIALVAIACLMLVSCSKDAEIEAFITEFDGVTQDMVKKIDANPSAAGIDEAQKSFDGKKAALKAKFDAIKTAVGFQVSDATKKKLDDSVAKNMKDITDVSIKHAMELASDPAAMEKFKKLLNDYGNTIK